MNGTTLTLCLIISSVMNTYCFKLAFIHDEGFNLFRPKSHAELWMAVVFDNFIDFSSQINVTHIEISSDDVAFDTPLTSVGVDREFEGFVLATISCGIGDVIESIVSPSMAPILRLYFSPCSQSPTAGLKAERLQLYQLNKTCRDFCGIFALNVWLEKMFYSLMDKETQQLLVERQTFRQEFRMALLH
ncbi:uncharacterized protein LOC123475861 [Daphnia magna]|uniref:uncharacterized protein LOC123475861 n=1 Tax=Daphnia magna TaxID=35525 RepID=UPI001E1BA63F|nr:uncharacterized protein LOC123475861 [Daphnia magna]